MELSQLMLHYHPYHGGSEQLLVAFLQVLTVDSVVGLAKSDFQGFSALALACQQLLEGEVTHS